MYDDESLRIIPEQKFKHITQMEVFSILIVLLGYNY